MKLNEIIWDITHAKLANENCQSVADIQTALNKKYNDKQTIAINKVLASIAMTARMSGVHTDQVIIDLFVASIS